MNIEEVCHFELIQAKDRKVERLDNEKQKHRCDFELMLNATRQNRCSYIGLKIVIGTHSQCKETEVMTDVIIEPRIPSKFRKKLMHPYITPNPIKYCVIRYFHRWPFSCLDYRDMTDRLIARK